MGIVLLIEDELTFAYLVERWLARAGIGMHHARSLAEAFEMAHGVFSAVISDLKLQNGEGISTLSRVRTTIGATPLIVMTGQDDSADLTEALGRHADTVLYKQLVVRQPDILIHAIELVILRKRVGELEAQVVALTRAPKRRRMKRLRHAGEFIGRMLRGWFK